jgi:hypothetical protein
VHLALGHLVSQLAEKLSVIAEGLQSFHHDKPVHTCHTTARAASNQHGVSCLKVVRVNEYWDTHGRRVRLF